MTVELPGDVEGVSGRGAQAEMSGQLVDAEQLARYWWAADFCRGRRVLDAGCGRGYGAKLLKQAGAAEVVAVDQSEAVIEVARQLVPDGVVCGVADLRSLPYKEDSFDLIVCFEVIEHALDRGEVLDQLARVLHPDGLLLVSSASRRYRVPGGSGDQRDRGSFELRAELETRFVAVRMVSQYAMLASVVTSPESASSDESRLDRVRVEHLVEPGTEDEIYTLAMAGIELPDRPPLVALTRSLELRQWVERFQAQERVLQEQALSLKELEALRRERQEALNLLAEREQTLVEVPALRERLAEAEADLDPLKKQITKLQGNLDEMGQAVRVADGMRASLSWRITAPLRGAKQLGKWLLWWRHS